MYMTDTNEHIRQVKEYIEDDMTATTFSNIQEGKKLIVKRLRLK